ncbi:hypothetical protein [Marimonas arenosa]|uniref:Lipoprotein n=1 Tax=Marimonas arenosa TaxID=1795305 RepID=A0AAE3W8L4_9RHOB|nr:hypothetical protein [Marimonas arenosa]MDQ2088451.1 hypothetical protein [Marimonas arenosa]
MRKTILVGLTAATLLTACGSMRDSALNPFNWFGRSRSEPVEANTNPLIPQGGGVFRRRPPQPYAGVPVDTIAELQVERVAGGAIVRVKGIATTQGWHEVRLVEDEDDGREDTLTYTLRALPSGLRELIGPPQSREIVAAKALTENDLVGIRTIRVKGATNARSTSRRF